MRATSKKVFFILALAWLLFCCSIYFIARPFFLEIVPLLVLVLIVSRGIKPKFIISVLHLTLVGLFGAVFLSLMYGVMDKQLMHFGFIAFISAICKSLSVTILGITVITGLVAGLGSKVLSKFCFKCESGLGQFLISIGLGIGIVINFGFFLAYFKILKLPVVIFLVVGLFYLSRKEIGSFFNKIARAKIRVKGDLQVVLFFSVFILVISHLVTKLRGFPLEFDSLSLYANTAKNLALTGRLPQAWSFPFGIELFMGFNWLLFGAGTALTINSLLGLLSVLAIYLIARKFVGYNFALFPSIFFYTTFAVAQLTYFDDKVDLGILFFGVLSVYAFLQWQDQRNKRYLLLSGVFAGMAFVVKYTAIFLMAGLLVGFVYESFQRKSGLRQTLIEGLSFLFFLLLPFIPWAAIHLYSSPPQDIHQIRTAVLSNRGERTDLCEITEAMAQCKREIKLGDYGYYFYPQSWADHFKRPLRLLALTNKSACTGRASIDPLYVGLFPLVIVLALEEKSKRLRLLLVIIAGYFIFWYLVRSQILWYALPGFALLSVVFFTAIRKVVPAKIKRVFLIIASVSILIHSAFYVVNNGTYFFLPGNADWKLQEKRFLLGDLKKASAFVNKVLQVNEDKKVFLLGNKPGAHFLPPYFINNSQEVAIYSNTCQLIFLPEQRSDIAGLRDKLKARNVEYVLARISPEIKLDLFNIPQEVGGVTPCILETKKNIDFFLRSYGQIVYQNSNYAVYRIR